MIESTDPLIILFETVRTMIPVVTGYIVLLVGFLGKLWESRRVESWRWAFAALIIAVASLGVCSGALAFCITASLASPQLLFYLFGPFEQREFLQFGRWCARSGHVLFFLSVAVASLFYMRVITQDRAPEM